MNFSTQLKWFSPTQKQAQHFKDIFQVSENPGKIEKIFYKKFEKYMKFISWIPGLRMVGIWNTISMNCAKSSSDIDLYIVTAPNRMWLVRILITFIFQILRVRKNI